MEFFEASLSQLRLTHTGSRIISRAIFDVALSLIMVVVIIIGQRKCVTVLTSADVTDYVCLKNLDCG